MNHPHPTPSSAEQRCDGHITDKLLLELIFLTLNFQRTVMTTLADFTTALNGVNDRLQKALAEIVAAIQAGAQTTPEMDAALAKLQAAAQALDDLNPDAPPA